MYLRNSDTKQLTVRIIVYKYLRPPTGVKAGKRNKTSPLDDRFCRGAHRLWAAVAQVVLVVRELLLVSEWWQILGWGTGSSQGTSEGQKAKWIDISWQCFSVIQADIDSLSLPGHWTAALYCRSVSGHSEDWFSRRFQNKFYQFLGFDLFDVTTWWISLMDWLITSSSSASSPGFSST